MTPLCEMIEDKRQTSGIRRIQNKIQPTGSYFADDSLIIGKSDAAAVQLHQTAEIYCREFGALLHAGKCLTIPITLHNQQQLSNEIKFQREGQTIIILVVQMGANISRGQIVCGGIIHMIKRFQEWENKARTLQRREKFALSVILGTLSYVVSLLQIDRKNQPNTKDDPRLREQPQNIRWGDTLRRCGMNNKWVAVSKRK